MKKLTLSTLVVVFLLTACQKNTDNLNEASAPEEMKTVHKRSCASNEVLEQQLAKDPSLKRRMDDIESFTKQVIERKDLARLVNGVIEIPVIVNVLYRTTTENISDAQVKSQVDVLNEDFNNTNPDKTKIPAEFLPVDATVGVRFVLAGTVRKKTTKKSWSTNDAMKKSAQGGINPTDAAHNLNLWACNLGQGLLGYAQFPGGSTATDGVVILYSAFGRVGTVYAPYNKGRTATHEVGHWMNLRHIWGDAKCGNDLVADTPPAATYNYGCPSYPHNSTCTGGKAEMTMNYMDYTDDPCMFMFTNGQKQRMLAIFASGGARAAIGK